MKKNTFSTQESLTMREKRLRMKSLEDLEANKNIYTFEEFKKHFNLP